MLKPIGLTKSTGDTDIAVLINVHTDPQMARDTIDSVRRWVSRKIVMIVDKKGWHHFENFDYPDTEVMCGVYHGVNRSPYKNIAIGMQKLYDKWPDATWYAYIESDVIVTSSAFKSDLVSFENRDITLAAIDHKVQGKSNNHWLVRDILALDRKLICHKTLGAVMFYSYKCMRPLVEKDFFNEVIRRTKDYKGANFPKFSDYAVEEIIFPSAAAAYGNIVGLKGQHTNPTVYRVRFVPNVKLHEISMATTIVHPTKNFNDPVREYARRVRDSEYAPSQLLEESKNVRLE